MESAGRVGKLGWEGEGGGEGEVGELGVGKEGGEGGRWKGREGKGGEGRTTTLLGGGTKVPGPSRVMLKPETVPTIAVMNVVRYIMSCRCAWVRFGVF